MKHLLGSVLATLAANILWGPLAAVGVAILAAGSYVGHCRWMPFGDCFCCNGKGKHRSKSGKTFRDCWFCAGGGRRLRFGRKVWNYFARTRKKGTA